MEAVIYFIIGIMGFSILFSIFGLTLNFIWNKKERKEKDLKPAV